MMHNMPKVTIAMAVYKPDLFFFKQQLESIDSQDYDNLELLIWNDSPSDFDCRKYVSQYMTRVSYRILDNGKNNGVTLAFEHLTKAADGEYIAYCDQDDIWLHDKVSKSIAFLENHPECACCHCECQLIDDNDRVIRNKIYPASLDIVNNEAYQKKTFFVKNWGVGCAMTMPNVVAKSALPFPTMVFHDQWLEMFALTMGKFYYMPQLLIKHRIHGTNNSQTLHGVSTKEDYYRLKLEKEVKFYAFLQERLSFWQEYQDIGKWIQAREKYAKNPGLISFLGLLPWIGVRPGVTLFELLIPLIPNKMFSAILNLIRKEVRKFDIR